MKRLSVFIAMLFIAGCFRDPEIEQILITNSTSTTEANSAYSNWKMKMENQDVVELENILKRKKRFVLSAR